MIIDKYTPCRTTECYMDKDGEIKVICQNGKMLKLKGIGRNIWLLLDGKHTISMIVEKVCLELAITDYNGVKKELAIMLKSFEEREAIIINWDPLYKYDLSQELCLDE